jgi:hypothetical protein
MVTERINRAARGSGDHGRAPGFSVVRRPEAEVTDSRQAELAARYGRRTRRRGPAALIVLPAALAALAGLGWLGWVAIEHANPPVASRLLGFEIGSATAATATIQVDRRDHVTANCRLQAKASDFSIVGESSVEVPADAPLRHVLTAQIGTQREATSVALIGCTVDGSGRPR